MKLQKMKLVLNPDQLEKYEQIHQRNLKAHEEDLRTSNTEHYLPQLNKTRESLDYYIKQVLPHTSESRQRIDELLTVNLRALIDQIKGIYFAKLDAYVKSMKIKHDRYYRDLVPNELLEYMTRDKLNRIHPDVWCLRDLEIVKKLMTDDLVVSVMQEYKHLEPVFAKYREFQMEAYERTGGSYGGGIFMVHEKEGDEYMKYLGLLLIEPDIRDNLRRIEV